MMAMNLVLREFLAQLPGRDLDRGGLKLHYIDEGEGLPVVMLHGNPTWSFLFRHLIAGLRDTHRVIVPDHIGCGMSEKPDDSRYDYTLASRAADLEFLLVHLGVTRDVTLVMHDWGGMIGMTYATRFPERIARLVVCNTAAFHLPPQKALPRALRLARTPALGAFCVRGMNAFCLGAAMTGCRRRPLSRELLRAYIRPYDSWSHRIAVLRFVQDIPLRHGDRSYELVSWVEERLGLLSHVPMLILWGMKDFVFDHYFLEEWVSRFPAADVRRFPLAGHYLFEDEAEAVNEAVRTFLKFKAHIG
jgi:haloalkane dehalogenase